MEAILREERSGKHRRDRQKDYLIVLGLAGQDTNGLTEVIVSEKEANTGTSTLDPDDLPINFHHHVLFDLKIQFEDERGFGELLGPQQQTAFADIVGLDPSGVFLDFVDVAGLGGKDREDPDNFLKADP
jgi:hypothetical protein